MEKSESRVQTKHYFLLEKPLPKRKLGEVKNINRTPFHGTKWLISGLPILSVVERAPKEEDAPLPGRPIWLTKFMIRWWMT